MAVRVDEITSSDWSIKVGDPGSVVEGIEDVDQCIGIILTTPKGADPLRPLFGCDAWKWLDAPVQVAIPNIVREAIAALEMWEPRIALVKVAPQVVESQITLAIEWKLVADNSETGTTEVPLGNAA